MATYGQILLLILTNTAFLTPLQKACLKSRKKKSKRRSNFPEWRKNFLERRLDFNERAFR